MGRLDQRFANAQNTWVYSRRGFPRYRKRYNAQNRRKHGEFHTIGAPNQGINPIGRGRRVD